MLFVIAVLFSLVVAIAAPFLVCVAKERHLGAVTAGAGAFVATMTLALGSLSLHPR